MGRSPARSGIRTSPLHACTRYTRQRIQRPDSPATSTRRAARLNRYAVQADAGSWHRPFPRSDRRAKAAVLAPEHSVAAIHGRSRTPRGPTRCACCSPNITPDYANRRAVTALANIPASRADAAQAPRQPVASHNQRSCWLACRRCRAGAVWPNHSRSPARTSLCAQCACCARPHSGVRATRPRRSKRLRTPACIGGAA